MNDVKWPGFWAHECGRLERVVSFLQCEAQKKPSLELEEPNAEHHICLLCKRKFYMYIYIYIYLNQCHHISTSASKISLDKKCVIHFFLFFSSPFGRLAVRQWGTLWKVAFYATWLCMVKVGTSRSSELVQCCMAGRGKWCHSGEGNLRWKSNGNYPLVNVHIAAETHHVKHGKIRELSMAMFTSYG